MKKQEILTKCKNEGLDEREQSIFLSSSGLGNIVTMVLCFIFVAINWIRGKTYIEFIIIANASLFATDFYKYKKLNHKKTLLVSSIMAGFVAILSFVMFIIKG